jgi:hypothetical protein
MVVQVLAADAAAVSIRIVPPAEDARLGDVGRKEITEPVFAICGRPSFVSMSVQPVDDDNTGISSGQALQRAGRLTLLPDCLPPPRPQDPGAMPQEALLPSKDSRSATVLSLTKARRGGQ